MEKTFVLSDESINSYGFRVLTEGINLENFKNNPIMLWNHTRSWSDKENQVLPIGTWKNIRVENGRLLAESEFDMDDEFAKKIALKVKKGILKMASIGICINEESDDKKYIVSGQMRKTVTRCTLREVSIVDIGSNANALALYDNDGNIVELSVHKQNCPVGLVNNKMNKKTSMNKIALKLGLPETASEEEIVAKIEEREKSSNEQKLRDRITELENEKKAANKKAIENLVDAAITEKKITTDKKNHFVDLGEKVGFESLKSTFDCMNASIKPNDIIGNGGVKSSDKKFSEMSESELKNLRDSDIESYSTLYEQEFGMKPKF